MTTENTEEVIDNDELDDEDEEYVDPELDATLTEEERLAKQREMHEKRRAKAKTSIRKGLVVVNTGNGKGKTTAALGLMFRAWGQGLRVCMLQFIKARTANWGEEKASRKMGLEILPLGDGFTWLSDNIEEDKRLAREGWELCKQKILSGDYDIVILDEMTYMFNYNWLTLDEVLEVLKQRNPMQHIVITGRYAPQGLIDYADLVTEMTEIKHSYKAGIKAQKGIEF
jgi:cob(I)alamin adenosyltransferase